MQQIKEFLQSAKDLFSYVYENYLYLIILAILLLVVIIFTCIFLGIKSKRAKKRKQVKANAKSSVSSLTQEEINNISNNVADRDSLIKMLTPTEEENDEIAVTKAKKKSKTTAQKNSENQDKVDETNVQEKVENKPVKTVKSTTSKTEKTTTSKTEKTPVHANPVVINDHPVKPVKKTYLGKWKIKNDGTKFYAELTASNGGLLLRTEQYTTLSGVKNGIETIKKNIENGNFAISVDKYGHYRFKLFSSSNRLICVSEDYSSRTKCENGIESVKRFAQSANIVLEEN